MACAAGAFFRQLDTVVVSLQDQIVVPISSPMIAFSWWQVGKRLVFDVPAKGVLQSDTTFGIQLIDHTESTTQEVAELIALAGSETESFRLVCDVSEIANDLVTLKCFMDYPFVVGIEPAPTVFSTVTIDTNFHPLEPQIYLSQGGEIESEITFQNIQFEGLPKTSPLVC